MAGRPSQDTFDTPERRSSGERRAVALTIVFHPEVDRVGEVVCLAAGTAELSRGAPAFAHPGSAARALDDRHLSRKPVLLSVAAAGSVVIDCNGGTALSADGAPLTGRASFAASEVERGVVLELADRVVVLLHRRYPPVGCPADLGLIGANDAMDELRRNITRVSDLAVPVLIRGETGSGKELVAHAVHATSKRARRPFVTVNISAIPPSTAASELFGHSRGAFTGATGDHVGYFAEAHTGSLFLDEIGAAPRDIQPMLLRALESNEIQPLGASGSRKVDVRMIAATDADLEQAISDESFRAALLHRLEGYQLFIPSLRERRDDIGRLVISFLRTELERIDEGYKLDVPASGQPTWLPAALVARLVRLDWPGNVRQLKNTVRQLTISSRGSDSLVIDAAVSRMLEAARPIDQPVHAAPTRGPGDISDDDLVAALRATDWIANKAASRLGVSRSYLYERIKASPRVPSAKDLPAETIVACRAASHGDIAETARSLDVSKRSLLLRMKELGIA